MAPSQAIQPRSSAGPAPLSFAQARMLFFAQLEPEATAYHSHRVTRWTGSMDAGVLERSLTEVLRRHDVLRTRFPVLDGRAEQVVMPAEPFQLPVVDLGTVPEADREMRGRQLAVKEFRRPFDLARGPVFRATLLRLGANEHWLIVAAHHLVMDGWSMANLHRELATLYSAFAGGRSSPLPTPSIQYADFACWQRERLQGDTLAHELAFWRERLAGASPVLGLPFDRPRPSRQTYEGAPVAFTLPEELVERLNVVRRQERVTLFMTLMAGLNALLSRYTGQSDIVVGAPIAGRPRRELEDLIGCFTNTLVLRTDCSGDPTFRELLVRVRETALRSYAHAELPFEKLVEEIHPDRDPRYHPIFQVMFNYRELPVKAMEAEGLRIETVEFERTTSLVDLTLSLVKTSSGFSGRIHYNTDLFDRETIERVARHYRTLLQGVAVDPGARLSALPLLSPAERRRLVVEWNQTGVAYPGSALELPALLAAQVSRTPDAVAVAAEQGTLTYGELDQRANAVASALRARGVGRGAYVPVLMDRSLELVIALLGVMKSGAAFVPLDPEWPFERLAQVLQELPGEAVLVSSAAPIDPAALGRDAILVDVRAPLSQEDSAPSHEHRSEPEAPIYAIYTSGSTGRPKAAVIPHRGITNRLLWMSEFFGSASCQVVLQTTRPVYDSAIWQLFWPLLTGGRTVLPAPGRELEAGYLAGLIAQHGVTMTDFVPSVFNVLVPQLVADAGVRAQLGSLQCLVVGGEEITPATTYRFREHFPGIRVVNLYGPTECAIGCIAHEVSGREGERIPIGRPIANVQVLVLDGHGQPVPVGVPGELYLTGACLGLGYLGDAAQTRAAFVPNPVGELAAPTLYRTGDRVRYRTDGRLEFLGRGDRQVKLRGHRIEPGEIEAVLAQHPAVEAAVVVLREDTPGERRLVGYVVPRVVPGSHSGAGSPAERAAPPAAVRDFLRARLPEYLVPAALVALPALPLTPGGKLDRAALPAPEAVGAAGGTAEADAAAAPRTPAEALVAGLWAELLHRPRVGVQENFFELGGHSLLAIQLIARLRAACGVELPLRTLFETPTVADMAGRLQEMQDAALGETSDAERLLPEVEALSTDQARLLLAAPAHETELRRDLDGMSDSEAERLLADAGKRRGRPRRTENFAITPRLSPAGAFVEFRKEEIRGSIPDRFQRQAQLYPERVAVRGEDGVDLTYRGLSKAADRIARILLAERGPAPERIALHFERGGTMIAVALGVLKAGKVWVPLDVAYPRERNAYILEHSGASLLLTDAAHMGSARDFAGRGTPVLAEEQLGAGDLGPMAAPAIHPRAIACILYTSGSTGVPKGVVHDHQTLLHFVMRYTNALKIGPDDRLAQFASVSHIAGVLDYLRGLLNGATVLPLDAGKEDPARLTAWLRAREITVCHMGPSLLRHVMSAMTGEESFPHLRLIHSGGETLSGRDVELYKRCFPAQCILLNNLGCTEVSSFCQYLIDHHSEVGTDTVPVGHPVSDTEVLLLDEAGIEVPPGRVGEIAVSSRYLARGYWREPARSRRAFIPAPGRRGRRVFRTGDLGRSLPDGGFVHVGRKDLQVQIRGYRVEPGEVERALLRCEKLAACAVGAVKDPQGETRLAAYVVPLPGRGLDLGELRDTLEAALPSYMIPAAFVRLDRLPVLPNGKPDRRALPAPDWSAPERERPYVAPRSEVERALADVWAEVLGVARIGRNDDFFRLGGNSLLATRVMARVRSMLCANLPVAALFEQPVLSGFAARIEASQGAIQASEGSSFPPPLPRGVPIRLSYAQQRMWLHNRLEPESSLYNLVTGGLGVSSRPRAGRWLGDLDQEAMERSLREIVRRHEVLRTRFPLAEGDVVPEVLSEKSLRLRTEDLTSVPAPEREVAARQRALAEIRRPFDLTREPPIRATLLRLAPEDHVLLLVVHHIAFDRWSRWVLLSELASLYRAFAAGDSSPLSPIPLQYGEHAQRERARVEGDSGRRELAYWVERLRGAPAALHLPSDRPRPARRLHAGATRSLRLSTRLTDRLEALSRSEGATLPMALLAVFKATLFQWTGQIDLAVGTIVAGRDRVELEGLIGCFTNTLVLRTDLAGDPGFRALLRRVRDDLLAGYSHQELPFEALVERLRPVRSSRYHPLFQVLFNYLDIPRPPIELPGLRIEDFELNPGNAPADLSLDVERTAEGITCYVGYSSDIFDAATIAAFAERYRTVLEAVATDPDCPLSALPGEAAERAEAAGQRLLADLEDISDKEAERPLAAGMAPHVSAAVHRP